MNLLMVHRKEENGTSVNSGMGLGFQLYICVQ